jgi:hypothetical protein
MTFVEALECAPSYQISSWGGRNNDVSLDGMEVEVLKLVLLLTDSRFWVSKLP